MTHIVIHDDSSQVTQYVEFDEVQAAATYLEDLVNEDSESNARLFELQPVEFAVKSYVRVEIGAVTSEEATIDEAPAAEVEEAAETADGPASPSPDVLPEMAEGEVFTDAPADDAVEYVEAAMTPADAYTPNPPMAELPDEPAGGDARRGLFGR